MKQLSRFGHQGLLDTSTLGGAGCRLRLEHSAILSQLSPLVGSVALGTFEALTQLIYLSAIISPSWLGGAEHIRTMQVVNKSKTAKSLIYLSAIISPSWLGGVGRILGFNKAKP